jgi:hypothetical protein
MNNRLQPTVAPAGAPQIIPPELLASVPKSLPTVVTNARLGTTEVAPSLDPRIVATENPDAKTNNRASIRPPGLDGWEIPLEIPGTPETDARGNPFPKYVAKYDPQGNFQEITTAGKVFITSGQGDKDTFVVPQIDLNGKLIEQYQSTPEVQNKSIFKTFADLALEVAPLYLAAVGGASLLGGAGAGAAGAGAGAAGAGAASSGTGLSLGGSGLGLSAGGAGLGLTAASPGAAAIGGSLGSSLAAVGTGVGAAGGLLESAGTGLTTGSTGTGLTTGGSGLGLTTESSGLGMTAASPGAASIGGDLGSTLSAVDTGVSAANVANTLSSAGSSVGSVPPVDYGLVSDTAGAASGTGLLDTVKDAGSSIINAVKEDPSLVSTVVGAAAGAVDAANAPKEQTSTTSIDPQIKAEYLANLERAKAAATNLGVRQFAQPGQMYTDAERKLYDLGMTPFGAADIQQFFNPYEEQVVQGALGDIERSRRMQDIADRERAARAGAFGGSRQAVQAALTNEAALRQAASTSAGLRSAGYTQAANLGLAARPMNIGSLQTSMSLGSQRDALRQAELDAARNIELERLAITGGALGLQPANVGQTSTQPLYNSGVGGALSGGLYGAYIGSLLRK